MDETTASEPTAMNNRSTVERTNSNQALIAALSKLEHEMGLREESQAALAQSQRMEALGQLAGGMAHDFNNVLAAIGGFTELLMQVTPSNDARSSDLREIAALVQRASALTNNLLGLSRRKLMELIASGDIATVRIPSKNGGVREHRIEPEEIERFKDLYRQRGAA